MNWCWGADNRGAEVAEIAKGVERKGMGRGCPRFFSSPGPGSSFFPF